MLSAFLAFKEPLKYVNSLTVNNEFKGLFLTTKEWQVIKHLVRIFQIFVKPYVRLQGQVYTTLPTALLYIYQIYSKLKALQDEFDQIQLDDEDMVSFTFFTYFFTYLTNLFL